jgi:hypothetical protein
MKFKPGQVIRSKHPLYEHHNKGRYKVISIAESGVPIRGKWEGNIYLTDKVFSFCGYLVQNGEWNYLIPQSMEDEYYIVGEEA